MDQRRRCVNVIVALLVASLASAALAAEPKVEISRAVFGSGESAIECTASVRRIVADPSAVTTISTPGLRLRNPSGKVRDQLVIDFTVDGKDGTLVAKNGEKVNLHEAILKAAGRAPAAAVAKAPAQPPVQPPGAPPAAPPQPAGESDVAVMTLPEKLSAFHLGAGGRLVICQLPKAKKLVILDIVERKVAKELDLPSDDARFVAGNELLLIFQPSQGIIQRYSLQTFERTGLGKLALDGKVAHFKMGYASSGPLWVWVPGKQVYAVNVNTFKPLDLTGVKRNGEERHWYDMRVSPDGSTFTNWHGAIGPVGFETTRLQGNALVDLGGHGAYSHGGRWFQPSADGGMILGWSGFLISRDMKPLACDTLQGAAPMVTADPRFFLALRNVDKDKSKLRLQIMTAGGREPILTVDPIDRCLHSTEPGVIFLPREKTLAVVSDKADRVLIRKLDLVEEMAKSADGPRLAVVSVPPTSIAAGARFDYQIETLPEKGLTIKLESGPPGMQISPQGQVVWDSPRHPKESTQSVIISVRDGDKNEALHAFDIELKNAIVVAANPPRTPVTPRPDPRPPRPDPTAPLPIDPNPGKADALGALGGKAKPPAASNGKGYVVISIGGIIGHHFTDSVLEQCLKLAEKEGVNTIVLKIDSLGGLSSELDKITKRLIAWQEQGGRAIAIVESRALSAAAIIAIACKELFMMSGSTIGATTEVGAQLEGAIKLKRESALGASDRALAQFTGRDYGLIQAMCDSSIELWMKPAEEGKPPALFALRPRPGTRSAPPAEGASLIKERDKVLTLTAQEAVTLGLAIGIVTDPGTVGPRLKIDGWREAGDGATKAALAAYKTAEESSKEINRLDAIIGKALGTPIGGSAAMLTRQLADHKAAKISATRLAKIIEASPYYSGMIDASSLDLAINTIDRRITLIEALIERERKR